MASPLKIPQLDAQLKLSGEEFPQLGLSNFLLGLSKSRVQLYSHILKADSYNKYIPVAASYH